MLGVTVDSVGARRNRRVPAGAAPSRALLPRTTHQGLEETQGVKWECQREINSVWITGGFVRNPRAFLLKCQRARGSTALRATPLGHQAEVLGTGPLSFSKTFSNLVLGQNCKFNIKLCSGPKITK